MKRCTGCQQEKDTIEFTKDRSRPDGMDWRCRTCRSVYVKAWRRGKHRDLIGRMKDKPARDEARFVALHAEMLVLNRRGR